MADRSGDVLFGGADREPGELWRRVPRWAWYVLALVGAGTAAVVVVVTGAGRPEPVPPPPLAALGPAVARLDDGGLLVRVEAELRTREPVVLRSGTITGGGLVLLDEPTPEAAPGAPDALTSQVVALLDPGCPEALQRGRWLGTVLEVVVAPQDGGDAVVLSSGVPVQALDTAIAAACAPVRAAVVLPPGSGPVAREVEITVRLLDSSVPVDVLGLTGRGLLIDLDGTTLAEQVAAGTGALRPQITVTAPVVVTDCAVEVLAPRRLVLEVQRATERLRVQVDAGLGVAAGLDELVRRTCRRPRI